MSKADKYIGIFLLCIIMVALGYWWAYSIFHDYQSQAERDNISLEQEFHQAWNKPHSFQIFQSQFTVYPIKSDDNKKRFHYKKVRR